MAAAAVVAPHAAELGAYLMTCAEVGDGTLEDFERGGGDHLVRMPFGEFWICPDPMRSDACEGLPWVTLRALRALGRALVAHFAEPRRTEAPQDLSDNDFGGGP